MIAYFFQYISESLQRKLESLKSCQLLLSKGKIALLYKVIPKESVSACMYMFKEKRSCYYPLIFNRRINL